MATQGMTTVGHDAAASLLQVAPEQLARLVSAGHVRRAAPGKYVPAQILRDYLAYLHAEPERRERSPTQQEIAEHLDMSERNLRDVLQLVGLDHKQASMGAVRVAYIRRLREQAAGRSGDAADGFDLVQERAALARAQREGIEIKNAVLREEYAPIAVLASVLATASQAIVERFEQLPAALKRSCPELPEAARDQVMATIAAARNEWVSRTATLVQDALVDPEHDEDEVIDA
jgi:phage terminase Nu1 subunit (DNA packaging protein)